MRRKDRLLLQHERSRFIITIEGSGPGIEEAFEGVLVDWDESHYVLAMASQLAANGSRVEVDHDLWLERPRVKYMQRL